MFAIGVIYHIWLSACGMNVELLHFVCRKRINDSPWKLEVVHRHGNRC